MKLSEAIRLGSTLHPQGFGEFRQPVSGSTLGEIVTCAWGAAHDAIGLRDDDDAEPESWLWSSKDTGVRCPADGCYQPTVGLMIVTLNDNHRWTRGQIADWVASVEPQEEQADSRPVAASLEVQAV